MLNLVVCVQQMMGLLPQGLFQVSPVQLLDIWVLVREADIGLGIQLPQLTAAGGRHLHTLVDGLTAAAGAAAGAGGDAVQHCLLLPGHIGHMRHLADLKMKTVFRL